MKYYKHIKKLTAASVHRISKMSLIIDHIRNQANAASQSIEILLIEVFV